MISQPLLNIKTHFSEKEGVVSYENIALNQRKKTTKLTISRICQAIETVLLLICAETGRQSGDRTLQTETVSLKELSAVCFTTSE